MMKRNPTRAARRVQKRVENRPIGDRIRSVFHSFGLAIRRRDRSSIEVIAANGNRSFQITPTDQFINRFTHLSALAITEPTDARRQSLELYAVPREAQPSIQGLIFRKQFESEIVCFADVFSFAG